MTPPAAVRCRTPNESAGVGVTLHASITGMPTTAQNLGYNFRELRRGKSRVVADANAALRVLVSQNIVADRCGYNPYVIVREIIRYDSAPAVCAEFDLLRITGTPLSVAMQVVHMHAL